MWQNEDKPLTERKYIMRMIYRAILILAIVLISGAIFNHAKASDLRAEFAFGQSKYSTAEDGLWYQSIFPHKNNLRADSGYIALLGKFSGSQYFGWRVSAVDLGKVSNQATFESDANFQTGCTECPTSNGAGAGRIYGITLAPTVEYALGKDASISAEFGAFLQHAYWSERVEGVSAADNAAYHQNQLRAFGGITARYSWAFVSWHDYATPGTGGLFGKTTQQLTAGVSVPF